MFTLFALLEARCVHIALSEARHAFTLLETRCGLTLFTLLEARCMFTLFALLEVRHTFTTAYIT